MYSAGLAEAAAPSSGPTAAGSPDPISSTHPQHGEHDGYRRPRCQHAGAGGGGGGGEGAPGWERGENGGGAEEEEDWGWPPQQGRGDAGRGGPDDDDGFLLVKWSEELDFDR